MIELVESQLEFKNQFYSTLLISLKVHLQLLIRVDSLDFVCMCDRICLSCIARLIFFNSSMTRYNKLYIASQREQPLLTHHFPNPRMDVVVHHSFLSMISVLVQHSMASYIRFLGSSQTQYSKSLSYPDRLVELIPRPLVFFCEVRLMGSSVCLLAFSAKLRELNGLLPAPRRGATGLLA